MLHALYGRAGLNSSALKRRIDSNSARCGMRSHGAADQIIIESAIDAAGSLTFAIAAFAHRRPRRGGARMPTNHARGVGDFESLGAQRVSSEHGPPVRARRVFLGWSQRRIRINGWPASWLLFANNSP